MEPPSGEKSPSVLLWPNPSSDGNELPNANADPGCIFFDPMGQTGRNPFSDRIFLRGTLTDQQGALKAGVGERTVLSFRHERVRALPLQIESGGVIPAYTKYQVPAMFFSPPD